MNFTISNLPDGEKILAKAREAEFAESSIGVINSWCNALFANGCDLMQAFFKTNSENHPELELSFRISEVHIVIGVAKIASSQFATTRYLITVTRFLHDKTYILKMYSTEALVHFLILARDAGILSLFPQSQVAFARNEY